MFLLYWHTHTVANKTVSLRTAWVATAHAFTQRSSCPDTHNTYSLFPRLPFTNLFPMSEIFFFLIWCFFIALGEKESFKFINQNDITWPGEASEPWAAFSFAHKSTKLNSDKTPPVILMAFQGVALVWQVALGDGSWVWFKLPSNFEINIMTWGGGRVGYLLMTPKLANIPTVNTHLPPPPCLFLSMHSHHAFTLLWWFCPPLDSQLGSEGVRIERGKKKHT